MNKKIILITFSSVLVILILMVSMIKLHPSTGTMKCIYESKTDVMNMKSIYIVKFKEKVVENLTTKETMQLNDDASLETSKTSFELLYSKYYGLNYYDNKVVLENKKLISTTNINYKKIDKDKLISIDSNNKNLFTNDNVRLTTLKKIYENNGAKCKYI